MMLLAASPGGSTANLFSYLFKGDLALNITLTAINSVIAALTLPIIVNFAIAHFYRLTKALACNSVKSCRYSGLLLCR